VIPIPFHRFANIFPLIGGTELRDLAEDIRLNGVRKAIDILDRSVLDGRNRYNALTVLLESGAPRGPGWGAYEGQPLTEEDFDLDAGLPWFRKYSVAESGDPLDYVWSLNFHRRQLTASQRAACAAEYDGFKHGGARKPAVPDQAANLPLEASGPEVPPAPPPMTQAERAAALGVSERIVRDADKVHERSPELHEAVKAGEVPADVAATLVEKPNEEVKALIEALPRDESGKLTPEAKREVRKVANEIKEERNEEKRQRREQREREQGAAQLALPDRKYGVIVADPEHDFEPYSRETGMDRHAANHYATSALETIMARRPDLDTLSAADCVLGLWVTDLANGLKILEAWGFTFKSYFVWVKDVIDLEIAPATLKALGLPERRYLQVIGAPGTGFWNRDRDELMLIGVRGNPPCPSQGSQGESVWFAARPHVDGTEQDRHSAKPDICFDWFDRHFPSFRKIELNARAARVGWDRWGLEAPAGEAAPESPANGGAAVLDGEEFDPETGELPALPWAAGIDAADETPAGGEPASHGA
jgi:N6-adenosine-specific RNA methylase IME4